MSLSTLQPDTGLTTGRPTDVTIDPARLRRRVERLITLDRPRFARLWSYFRNPTRPHAVDPTAPGGTSDRPYRQAQEWGLPARITGVARASGDVFNSDAVGGIGRKEVVIENDLAWRVETMVDYLFGKPIVIDSAAPDPIRRQNISALLRQILASNGGILFLQQLATLGAVYGFVDVLVKFDPMPEEDRNAPCDGTQSLGKPPVCDGRAGQTPWNLPDAPDAAPTDPPDSARPASVPVTPRAGTAPVDDPSSNPDAGASHPSPTVPAIEPRLLARLARMIRLEIVEPARALPLLSHDDWRVVEAFGTYTAIESDSINNAPAGAPGWTRLLRFTRSLDPRRLVRGRTESAERIEIITPTTWQCLRDGVVVSQGRNTLGRIPLVHIQNASVPCEYAGLSDVEPLLPLQDELNTRLSDRAHRITMQSFKMYLGRGIDHFNDMPVAPGRMWSTDNENANVIEFGGDSACPSEDAHLAELREAMDKASGVSPIAAGAIKGRIGRLTSAAALRVTMLALLSRTEKKRTTYGRAIEQLCELSLAWLHHAGVFHTTPDERQIEIHWPNPLPVNEVERLEVARSKIDLGVARDVVLRELGY